ncbi:Hexose transporter [Spironucleus salmonicida]|uniref:Hexose transporter n=1 Tax=Spironucleus salmonicida TaxID=348837 RepID=V6LW08_9EUKA|nr:Hexose transporter [Spironucleus salmonicida]|eukprot:EST47891.1 Hexose transporter [Spironucleus salmonicida]
MIYFYRLLTIQLLAGISLGSALSNMSRDIIQLYYMDTYGISFDEAEVIIKQFLPLLSTSSIIGFAAGSSLFSLIAKFLGFKLTAMIGCTGVFLFTIGQCIPVNEYFLFIMRVLAGFFQLLFMCPTLVIVGEHALPQKRGILGMWFQFGITIGIFINSIILLVIKLTFLKFNCWWASFCPAILSSLAGLILLFFTPDVQKRIHKEVNYSQIFTREYGELLLCTVFLGINQQWTGINGVIVFANEIFKNQFNSEFSSIICNFVIASVNIVFTVIALLLIERLGRRRLLFTGLTICFMSQCIILSNYGLRQPSQPLLLGCYISFIIGFAVGPGPILYVLASEIFPISAKSMFIGILMSCNYVSHLFVIVLFPILTDWANFILYISLTISTTFVLFFYCPETKGKTQAEIQETLANSTNFRISVVE